MTPIAQDAIGELIGGALVGYDGMILSGGTAEGVPGLVARAAARSGSPIGSLATCRVVSAITIFTRSCARRAALNSACMSRC
jgi:hypothetical protein